MSAERDSASYKQKPVEEAEEKNIHPISGKVTVKKPGVFKKLIRTIFSDDSESVKTYIVQEVLIPSIKNAVSEIMTSGTNIILYGDAKKNKPQNGSNSRISYSSYSNYYSAANSSNKSQTNTVNAKDNDREFILETRGEAENVLIQLNEILERYHMVSLNDLNDILNITGPWTDQKYGWTDLSNATIVRVRDGYLLSLPRVRPLN